MRRHARVHTRGSLAMIVTLGVTAGLCAATAGPAAADTSAPAAVDETVIPAPGRYKPRDELLWHAGTRGYAHRMEGTGTVWTDFATGTHTPIPTPRPEDHSGLSTTIDSVPADQPRTLTVSDLATGSRKAITLPGGQIWAKAYNADTAVTYTEGRDGTPASVTLWQSSADGTTVERAVAKPPAATGRLFVLAQDTRGALVRFRDDGGTLYLLDYASATVKPLPERFAPTFSYSLGERHIVAHASYADELLSVPRADLTAAPVTTDLPGATGAEGPGERFSVVGDTLLFQRTLTYPENGYEQGNAVRAIPVGGGPVTRVLARAEDDSFVRTPEGDVLVVGGGGSGDWALRRITVDSGGAVKATPVRALPPVPATLRGLALGGGRLSYLADTERDGMDGLYDLDTKAATPPAPKLRMRVINASAGLASLGDGQSAYAASTRVNSPTTTSTLRSIRLPTSAGVVDGSGRYVLAQNGTTAYVGDLENHNIHTPDVPFTTDSAAALWDTKVWKPAATAGQVDAYDLGTKKTSAAVDIKSGCRPTELQAVGRWLYWACGADKAGVYDRTLKKSVAVPAGEALLGDGYVVRHEGDKLKLTDAATGLTTDFADLRASSGSGRRETWTVDRFGGGVAYLDAARDIRVRQVPVSAQPMAALASSVPAYLSFGDRVGLEPDVEWKPVWRFSRQVGPWRLTVKDRDGVVVRSTGGDRGDGAAVRAVWDGHDTQGRGLLNGTYHWSLEVLPVGGTAPAEQRTLTGTVRLAGSSATTVPGTFAPLTPTRIMDTRTGLGVPRGKLGAGGWTRVKVTGTAGVPATTVTAVVLNVTATNPTASSFVSVYPGGTPRTSASNLNFAAGRTAANLVTVPVVNGYVEFFNKNGAVDLLADVAGYHTERWGGALYQPVTPKRLMDTRDGTGVPKAKVGPGRTVTLPVTEPGVRAVVLNVTATAPTATGFVSVYPYGTARPTVSNLNFTAGRTVPNLVVVPVEDGKVTFYNHAGTVDLIADVSGYYKDAGSRFTGMQPRRLMDTRDGTGVPKAKVGAGKTVTLEVGTKYTAVVLNVTATDPTAAGFVSVYPYGTQRAASNLNFTAGQTVPNLVIVPVKDGKVTFYNHTGTVDLIADAAGYFTG
ncbi:hypothetical protein [Streptomyces sp. NBC_01216]|uniref:hypothetical protein n=1 Tax=unclassified Streptomyces TaxID=2593676 RepID=UPI002E1667AB|nr:hypothetical protein OG393_18155 [Streptomyces sp. NBC_01216]